MPNDLAPTRQAIEAKDRSAPGKVSGKLLNALTSMIWQGLTRKQAAQHAGMSEHGLWNALRKPHVRQWLSREMQVLRTSERPRNHFALVDVRDNAENSMARVSAVKALEAIDGIEAAHGGSGEQRVLPGLTIVITNTTRDAPLGPTIEHEPGDDE